MNTEERTSILTPLPWPILGSLPAPFPWPPPRPWPEERNDSGKRSPEEINTVIAGGPEILKRLYFRPDYQALIKQYTGVMMKQLEHDQEAQKALQDLIDQHTQGERILPILAAIAVGAALGYWAESKHH